MSSSSSFAQRRFSLAGKDWLNQRRSLVLPKFWPSVRNISGDVLQGLQEKWATIGNEPRAYF